MKRITMTIAVIVMAAGMMTSCSGGDAPAKDGPFGKLPAIIKGAQEQAFDMMTKLFSASNKEEAGKIMDEVEKIKKQAEEDATKAFDEIKNKEVPVEVSEEVPVKFTTPLTITEFDVSHGKVMLEGDIETTAPVSYYQKETTFPYHMIRVILIDKEGNPSFLVGKPGTQFEGDPKDGIYPAGTKGHFKKEVEVELWNADMIANMSKVRIVEFDSDIYKQAKEVSDTAKARDNERQRELFKNIKISIK